MKRKVTICTFSFLLLNFFLQNVVDASQQTELIKNTNKNMNLSKVIMENKDLNTSFSHDENPKATHTNKVIHLYKEQIGSSGTLTNDFLQSYEQFFSKNAQPKISLAVKTIDHEKLKDAASKIELQLLELYEEFSKALPELSLPDSILFIGDQMTDGHGIKVKNSWYLFIDLNTVVAQHRQNSDMKWFLAHELVHAIHYSLMPEFFKGNHSSVEDYILKFMMAEGIATWVTVKIIDIPENLAFWGNFLSDSKITQWRKNAAESKPAVAQEIAKWISKNCFDSDFNNRLFNVLNMENLEQKRIGYLYGFEIVDAIAKNKTVLELIKTPYSEMRPLIKKYFSIGF